VVGRGLVGAVRSTSWTVVAIVAVAGQASAAVDRRWENPVYHSTEEAVAAATVLAPEIRPDDPPSVRLFVDLTLNESRTTVGNLLVTYPEGSGADPVQRATVERFVDAIPREREVVEQRLARFGYPELPGMAYCRLVESVDAFAGLGASSTDKMSQIGGVTYYCRYVVLPLSFVGRRAVAELRRSAARNPGIDVDGTIRGWQNQSYGNLINTFRHELVHVHTNSALDVPRYSDRGAVPTWFHEGSATYLAADPRGGLSERYREYQGLFFYLVQRFGVPDLQAFFAEVLGGSSVSSALAAVYEIPDGEQLFARSARWHLLIDRAKTALWIVVLVVAVGAFRSPDRPYIGGLLMLVGVTLGAAVATGLAEQLFGLRGPAAVLVAKLVFTCSAVVLMVFGVRRVVGHHTGLHRADRGASDDPVGSP
jgi:hypothetical protein